RRASKKRRYYKISAMPYRHPGSPGASGPLSGKPIGFYRPRGSQEVRHLIDEGFQAFNAARLGEACRIFSEKMLDPAEDTTTVLLETDAYVRDFLVREQLDGPIATAELHYRMGLDLLKRYPGCEEHSVVARAALAGVPIYTSSPGDSSIGMNLAYHALLNESSLMIDPHRDA